MSTVDFADEAIDLFLVAGKNLKIGDGIGKFAEGLGTLSTNLAVRWPLGAVKYVGNKLGINKKRHIVALGGLVALAYGSKAVLANVAWKAAGAAALKTVGINAAFFAGGALAAAVVGIGTGLLVAKYMRRAARGSTSGPSGGLSGIKFRSSLSDRLGKARAGVVDSFLKSKDRVAETWKNSIDAGKKVLAAGKGLHAIRAHKRRSRIASRAARRSNTRAERAKRRQERRRQGVVSDAKRHLLTNNSRAGRWGSVIPQRNAKGPLLGNNKFRRINRDDGIIRSHGRKNRTESRRSRLHHFMAKAASESFVREHRRIARMPGIGFLLERDGRAR